MAIDRSRAVSFDGMLMETLTELMEMHLSPSCAMMKHSRGSFFIVPKFWVEIRVSQNDRMKVVFFSILCSSRSWADGLIIPTAPSQGPVDSILWRFFKSF
jgi:hypothetical protein